GRRMTMGEVGVNRSANSGTAPPTSARPTGMPSVPPQQTRATTLPPAPDKRRTAFAEGLDQLRAAATTEPGRLRIIGAVLALLVVAFGAVTAWQVNDRATAADSVLNRSQPISSDA